MLSGRNPFGISWVRSSLSLRSSLVLQKKQDSMAEEAGLCLGFVQEYNPSLKTRTVSLCFLHLFIIP